MGEIADAMINGEMCEQCGDWLGGDEGYPRLCGGCGGDATQDDFDGAPPAPTKVRCPICKKRCANEQGLRQHTNAKHRNK